MYAVRYTIDNDTVLVTFVKAKSAEQASRLAYHHLMSMYEKFSILGTEPTSMNVFVNPESCNISFD